MKEHLWLAVVTRLAYCMDKELWKAIDYFKEQVRVLKEQHEKEKRIFLDNGYDPEPDLTCKTTWKQSLQSHWNVLSRIE